MPAPLLGGVGGGSVHGKPPQYCERARGGGLHPAQLRAGVPPAQGARQRERDDKCPAGFTAWGQARRLPYREGDPRAGISSLRSLLSQGLLSKAVGRVGGILLR